MSPDARLDPFVEADIPVLLSWLEGRDAAFLAQFAGPAYSFPLDAAQLRATLAEPGRRCFAYRDGAGRLVGHCQVSGDPAAEPLRLGRVLVDPARRGEGWGQAMLGALMDATAREPGVAGWSLRVYEFNIPARRCYERLGFRETARELVEMRALGAVWACLTLERSAMPASPS